MGMFGFGTTENKTTTNVQNQQVATESGIALGANSTNTVSIMTADPEIAKASFAATLGAVKEVSAANVGVSEAALKTNLLTSQLAIAAGVDTAKVYSEVDFHMFYRKDIEDFAPAIANPTNVHVYGTRTGELKSFL